jgi:hypothetical protein
MTGPTARISQLGLALTLPAGWEGAIYRRAPGPGESTHPVVHAATVPLPPARGDFGSLVVDQLGADDVFVALLEYQPGSAGEAMFRATAGVPGLTPDMFSPYALQRLLPGQAGSQQFFTTGGRAFCLYVVLGSFANRSSLVAQANAVLATMQIQPGGQP